MIKKFTLGLTAAAAALTVMPAAAMAQGRDGYYDQGRYQQSHRRDNYRGRDNYYSRNQAYYGRGGYDNRYDGYNRYDNRGYGQRCSGTTGTILGAVAGGLLGREVAGRRGGRTTGAILGGAVGALAGRAIDKSDCRR